MLVLSEFRTYYGIGQIFSTICPIAANAARSLCSPYTQQLVISQSTVAPSLRWLLAKRYSTALSRSTK